METYITICEIDNQREFAAWLRKLKQGLCMNLEGWDGEGDGREVQKGGDAVILEPRKIKPATVSIFSPSICHEVMGPDAMILVF